LTLAAKPLGFYLNQSKLEAKQIDIIFIMLYSFCDFFANLNSLKRQNFGMSFNVPAVTDNPHHRSHLLFSMLYLL
jgi:hypothetical protein